MRILFTSDFHGSREQYKRLGRLLPEYKPALLIMGGDMLPDGRGGDPAGDQAAWVLDSFRAIVEQYKNESPEMAAAVCMGNHDWLASEEAIRELESAGCVRLLDPTRIWRMGDVNFLGFYYSPPSPHFAKDFERLDLNDSEPPNFDCENLVTEGGVVLRLTADQHFRNKESLADVLANMDTPEDPWIFLSHAPPYDTKLDRLPNINYAIGSRAVRNYIERSRPLCALHGHVHESPEVTGSYLDDVNGTPCINPGQSHERLQAVVFDTDDILGTIRHTVFE